MDCFFCGEYAGKVGRDIKAVLCGSCTGKISDPPVIKTVAPVEVSADPDAPAKPRRGRPKGSKNGVRKEIVVKETAGRGRGWHLKKKYEHDGKFYSFGKVVSKEEFATI